MGAVLACLGLPCPLKPLFDAIAGKSISCEHAQKLLSDGYTYLDVRTPEEFAAGHVPHAINIPYRLRGTKNEMFIEEVASKFDKDAKLVVACQGGVRSAAAVKELKALGYINLADMGPGYGGWARNGLATTNGE